MVKSDAAVDQIGNNYLEEDMNPESTDHDGTGDIIMRDSNTVYIKYANDQDRYSSKDASNFDTNFYVQEFTSPQDMIDKSTD